MSTLTTSDVSKRLGFTVAPAFIESLGVKPAEYAKGKARWAESDFADLCELLAEHVRGVGNGSVKMATKAKPIPRQTAKKTTAAMVDDGDDDEL